jgi:hypothetical protein
VEDPEMKTSDAVTLYRDKAGDRPENANQGDLFVLVIDRKKMVKQLLEAVHSLGLPLEK